VGISSIEWTDVVWNCIRGCVKVSPGCKNCYAETFAERWRGVPGHPYEQGFDLRLVPEKYDEPRKWKKPRKIFVNSMSDLFQDDVPEIAIYRVLGTIQATPQHTYQILTKRPERALRIFQSIKWAGWPLPNLWLGVSAENQEWADKRIPLLLQTPAAVRFVSYEPALGPVDFRAWLLPYFCPTCEARNLNRPCAVCGRECYSIPRLNQIIVGGESGPGARSINPEWATSVRDQCVDAKVPFFFKQWGGVQKKKAGRLLEGREWNEFPA
jgi:protein gp37